MDLEKVSFSDPSLWPSGVIVHAWKGPIDPLPPLKMRRYAGNFSSSVTTDILKEKLVKHYEDQNEDVEILVEDFYSSKEGWTPNGRVKNFVIEISNKATDGDRSSSVPNHLSFLTERHAYVRFWNGPMPSRMKRRAGMTNNAAGGRTASLD